MKYLLTRDGEISNSGTFDYDFDNLWFCDASRNRRVVYSSNLKRGDEIYIAEKGYAIIGVGMVEIIEQHHFVKFSDFVEFGLFRSKIKQAKYWYEKFQKYYGKKIKKLHVQEIKAADIHVFDTPYTLSNIKIRQGSWTKLPDTFRIDNQMSVDSELISEIPSHIRFKVYNDYKLTADRHLIDIDHHVPKSLGGPGNIVENLVPVASSINRYKSNHVPSKLFNYGKSYGIEVPDEFLTDGLRYFRNRKAQQIAKSIISKINEDVETARTVYKEIKISHFPAIDRL